MIEWYLDLWVCAKLFPVALENLIKYYDRSWKTTLTVKTGLQVNPRVKPSQLFKYTGTILWNYSFVKFVSSQTFVNTLSTKTFISVNNGLMNPTLLLFVL